MNIIDGILEKYERATWLRALVQLPPGGGSVDVLLAGRASTLNQQRVEELIANVSMRIDRLGGEQLKREFLASDEFFEIFRTAAEVVAHTASAEKRLIVSDYLSGTIYNGVVTDLGAQVLEDLKFMQSAHLQVLAALPAISNQGVSKQQPPEAIDEMPPEVYEKVMSDLERFGFIRYNTAGIGAIGGGAGHWETTEYVRIFRMHIESLQGVSEL